MIKATHDRPRSDIILNSEKLKEFALRSGTRHIPPTKGILSEVNSHSFLPPALNDGYSTPYSIHLSRLSQSTGLSSLCYTAASHQLAILHVIYIHMFQCYSLNAFHFSQLPTALPCLSVQCQADRKKDVWPVGSSAWGAQSQSGRCH